MPRVRSSGWRPSGSFAHPPLASSYCHVPLEVWVNCVTAIPSCGFSAASAFSLMTFAGVGAAETNMDPMVEPPIVAAVWFSVIWVKFSAAGRFKVGASLDAPEPATEAVAGAPAS